MATDSPWPQQDFPPDLIRVNEILFYVSLVSGAYWPSAPKAKLQPVSVSLAIPYDIRQTASTDDLVHSINYSVITNEIRNSLGSKTFQSLEDLSNSIGDVILARLRRDKLSVGALRLKVVQLKAPLHCKTIGVEFVVDISSNQQRPVTVKHFLEGLLCPTIVGVNECERLEKQDVQIRLSIDAGKHGLAQKEWVDFRALVRKLYEEVGKTDFETLEALTSFAAVQTLQCLWDADSNWRALGPVVNVAVAKPSALVYASSSEVEISRTFTDFPDIFSFIDAPGSLLKLGIHTAVIALGSNLGDSFHNIELALRLLETPQDLISFHDNENAFPKGEAMYVSVVNTSFMYETSPMYVTDQPPFTNCACIVETNLQPVPLLRLLKKIETTVGRVPSIRNGPRAVDLDIIYYDDVVFDTRQNAQRGKSDNLEGELVVPHPRLAEREFVLRPLHDMIPDYIDPMLKKTVSTLLANLPVLDSEPPMKKVIPFPQYPLPADYSWPHPSISPVAPTGVHWTYPLHLSSKREARAQRRKTHIMATLNATPDSFSDGALHNTTQAGLAYAKESVKFGATIIDVGGYSTRPGASFVSVEEEIQRVVPNIQAIREIGTVDADQQANVDGSESELGIEERMRNFPISIDTFRWEVAEASIKVGANCINDVYAFTGPDSYLSSTAEGIRKAEEYMTRLKQVAGETAVPVVLMHSRGNAGENKDYSMYDYAGLDGAVVEGVRVELGEKVERIVKGKGGVRRWLVIMDPGVGFSKTVEGNLEVLRDAAEVTADVEIGDGSNKRRNPLRGYPQLIGTSKKSFLGAILAQDGGGRSTSAKERTWATAAGVACAVQQGALIVRVHDTKEMADVVTVADALWS